MRGCAVEDGDGVYRCCGDAAVAKKRLGCCSDDATGEGYGEGKEEVEESERCGGWVAQQEGCGEEQADCDAEWDGEGVCWRELCWLWTTAVAAVEEEKGGHDEGLPAEGAEEKVVG